MQTNDSYTDPYYCIDKDYDRYLNVRRERRNTIPETTECRYNINPDSNTHLNRENSIEREYDNDGYDIDPDFNIHVKSIKEKINKSPKAIKSDLLESNKEDPFQFGLNGQGDDLFFDATENDRNETFEPTEYDRVESNMEDPINNQNKFSLRSNGQCLDLILYATENDRNETFEATEYDRVESNMEDPINNQNKFSLGSNGQCLDLILYATENDKNETFETIEYELVESNMEDPINNKDKFSLGSNGQCLDLILYATENDRNETFEAIEYDNMEAPINNTDTFSLGSNGQCLDLILYATENDRNETFEAIEYDLVESNMEDPINNIDEFSLGSNGQCEESFLDASEKDMNDLTSVRKKSDRIKDEGEDGECSSDIETLMTSDALDYGEGNLSPFVSSKVYLAPLESEGGNWQCSTDDKARSKFREDVMAVYQKSYDRGELDELLEEVQLQKSVTGWKNLRGRSVPFPTSRNNKSYLDHYPDLKTELDRVFLDPPKMLNTLRGFFYWLKNISREGAFKPWLDPLCKDVKSGHYNSHLGMTNTKEHSIDIC